MAHKHYTRWLKMVRNYIPERTEKLDYTKAMFSHTFLFVLKIVLHNNFTGTLTQ